MGNQEIQPFKKVTFLTRIKNGYRGKIWLKSYYSINWLAFVYYRMLLCNTGFCIINNDLFSLFLVFVFFQTKDSTIALICVV